MITRIKIERFKNIRDVEISLGKINVLVGGNNAGKSSILQAIQFSVSLLQTLSLTANESITFSDSGTTKSLSPEQIIYSPIKDVYHLYYGEALREGQGRDIIIELDDTDGDGNVTTATVAVSKGRNKNIIVKFKGAALCMEMADLANTFSMYVPGLSGVPFSEEVRSIGAVRRAAAKGDCNTILRNVLHCLSQDPEKQKQFLSDLDSIFPSLQIKVDPRLENDGVIDVVIENDHVKKPLDAAGTGVLQAIQICAYVNYFEPQLLLLDEPDAHLHPNNQKMLADMIIKLSSQNRTIMIATHSRHLVSSLRKEARVLLVQKGSIKLDSNNEYDILMELGALDEYDVFRNPDVKYIIATEDTQQESNKILRLILESSGLPANMCHVIPYEGCSNVASATYVAKCLQELRQDLQIIIHRDRDGMTDEKSAEFKSKIEREANSHCFITENNDLEMYICNASHLHFALSQKGLTTTKEDMEALVERAINNTYQKSLEKFLNRELDKMREQNRGEKALELQNYFGNNITRCFNGHCLFGEIVQLVHQQFGATKNDLLVTSPFLRDQNLASICA